MRTRVQQTSARVSPVLLLLLLGVCPASAQEVQVLEHDTVFGTDNSLVQVDADIYALAYTGQGIDGFLKTFTISADGMTITQVQALEHDTLRGSDNSLVAVDADTYALAYTGQPCKGLLIILASPEYAR